MVALAYFFPKKKKQTKKGRMDFLEVAEALPAASATEPAGGTKREREEEPVALGEPQEKRSAVVSSGMDPLSEDLTAPAYHDFSSNIFNANLDLEGRPMEHPPVPEHLPAPPPVLAPLAAHVPSPDFVTLAAAFRDPVLSWEDTLVDVFDELDKFARLDAIRISIDKRKHEILAGYDAEKERLVKERLRLVNRLQKLRQELAAANPEAEWRAAMRDPVSGVAMLSNEQCLAILTRLMATEECKVYFCQAVDPIAQGILAYFDIIDRPMDLGKVLNQLKAGLYERNTDLFIADVRLVFRNCECFNGPFHDATTQAVRASEMFEKAIRDPNNFQVHIKTKSKAKKSTGGGSSSNALSASASKIASRPAPRRYAGEEEDDEEMARAKKGGGDSPFDALQLTHVRLFCEEVTKHPGSLKKKKLGFFKDFLDRWFGTHIDN